MRSYPYFARGEDIAGSILRQNEDGTLEIRFHGPPDYETDAVAFRIRLLTHNDEISFRRLGELFDHPGISEEWRDEYERWAGGLHMHMGQTYAEGPKGILTYRKAFEMELHGHRGHYKSTGDAFKLYRLWVTDDSERQMLEDAFHRVLIWVVYAGQNLAAASRKELSLASTT